MHSINLFLQSAEQRFHGRSLFTRNKTRLTAAFLYGMTACFLGIIVSVLVSSWGKEGLNLALASGSTARYAVIYMLAAGIFSLVAAILLASSVSLSKRYRLGLLACALMLMLIGLIYAAPAVAVAIAPFWFLLKFHRDTQATASPAQI